MAPARQRASLRPDPWLGPLRLGRAAGLGPAATELVDEHTGTNHRDVALPRATGSVRLVTNRARRSCEGPALR